MSASESNPIILYDIKSAPPLATWSPAVWKARLVLNYKRLPYKTVWLSMSEIASTLSSLGLAPLDASVSYTPYTLPIIVDPAPIGSNSPPTIVRDSTDIARYLDAKYPDPQRPLYPGGSHALQALFQHHLDKRVGPTAAMLIVPLVPTILDEPGAEYFHRTRTARFGKPVAELRPTGAALTETWDKVKLEFDALDTILRENDVERGGVGGPLVLGNQVSWADFALVGLLLFISKVDSEEDGNPWDKIKGLHVGIDAWESRDTEALRNRGNA